MRKVFVLILSIAITFILLAFGSHVNSQGKTNELADTPWPMYQHDPQHTGRSPFQGPLQMPELLWTTQLPDDIGESGGISIAKDGSLLISIKGHLFNYDPYSRTTRWQYEYSGNSRSIALVAEDDFYYWGFENVISRITLNGSPDWMNILDLNMVFGSSPVFGSNGNLYFVHDAVWSFTPSGDFQWVIPYGEWGTHASPAVGIDGNIYAGTDSGHGDICAYAPNGDIQWCLDSPGVAFDRTVAIGQDGTIYLPTYGNYGIENPEPGILVAINPSGTVKWHFHPDETNIWYIPNGVAIGPDGSIYFGLNTPTMQDYLYSINSNGQLNWKVTLTSNPITGLEPNISYPITADRNGDIYFCSANSRCYGVSRDGNIMWVYEFPLIDSVIITSITQPIIGQDGLLYIIDSQSKLYAFADPNQFPFLRPVAQNLEYNLDFQTPAFTDTVAITSTVMPITYTASIVPTVEWLSIVQPVETTPTSMKVQIDPSKLPAGTYHTSIVLKPTELIEKEVIIPVNLNIKYDSSSNQVYLPYINNFGQSDRILFTSKWFLENQLASIKYDGTGREVIAHNLPVQIDTLTYSPDGHKVAFMPNIMDTETGEMILVIPGYSPAWSPDSQRIAYIWSIGDEHDGEVYTIYIDGTDMKRLTNDDLNENEVSWSPNGRIIAVGVNYQSIFIMNTDGSDFHQIVTGNFRDRIMGWSPDGKYLLLISQTNGYAPYFLVKYELTTGTYTFLANYIDGEAKWSPDGSHIAYRASEPETSYDKDIYVIDANGTNKKDLTHELYNEEADPNWSPNSQWIVFTSRNDDIYEDPNYDIYVVKIDGSELKKVTTNIQVDNHPFWVPY